MDAPHPLKPRIRRLSLAIATAAVLLAGCADNEDAKAAQADIHITSSQAYRDQGQYRAALIEARNAVQLQPQNTKAQLALADIYLELGSGQAAADLLSKSEDSGEVALPLALAYIEQGKHRSASEALADPQITSSQRNSADFLLAEAKIASYEKRLDDAERILRKAVREHPENSETAVTLVALVLQRDGPEAAAQLADTVLEDHPNKPDANLVRAEIAQAKGETAAAEQYLTEALSRLPQTDVLTPIKARVLSRLVDVVTQQGRTTEALVYRRLLAEANPDANEMRQQYSDAITQFQAGDLEAAENTLTELYDRNRRNDASALFLGLVNLRQGELDQAIELFDQHLDPETASPEMIRAATLAKLQKNRPEEALALLREALEDRPNDPDVQAVFGLSALGIPGAEEEGVVALQKAIAQDPEKVSLRLALADYYFRQQQPEQALAQLKTAADAAPTNFAVQRAYVSALLRGQETAKARQVTKALTDTASDQFFTWLLAAQTSLAAEDYPAALQELSKAAALAPREPAPLLGLAELALKQREWTNAARYFERAIALRGDLDQAYKGIITAHESAGSAEAGLAKLESLAKDANNAATANSVLAHYHLLHRDLEKARQYTDKALASGAAPSRYTRGVAAQVMRASAGQARAAGNLDEARDQLLDALGLIPNSLMLTSDLVAVEIAAGRYDEAEALLGKMDGPAGQATAAGLRAAMLADQGKLAEAQATLAEAWEQNPTARLANQRYLLAKRTEAPAAEVAKGLEAWQAQFPQDPRPLMYLGMESQTNGDTAGARDHYEAALALNPDNALVLNNLAWLRFEAGEEEAVELAKRAVDLAPGNAAVLDTYGWILVQRGERDEGVKWLEKAVEAAPESNEIRQHLDQARSKG